MWSQIQRINRFRSTGYRFHATQSSSTILGSVGSKMSTQLALLLLVTLSALLGVSGLKAVGKGYSLVLVGGGLYDNNTAIWERIIELGGGKGSARFGVISAASEVGI